MLRFVLLKNSEAEHPTGAEYVVQGNEAVILGRDSKADICIAHPKVSRQHVKFELKDDGWHILNLSDKNPATFNSVPLDSQKPLGEGDHGPHCACANGPLPPMSRRPTVRRPELERSRANAHRPHRR